MTIGQGARPSVLTRPQHYQYVACLACRSSLQRSAREDCGWCHGAGEILKPSPPLAAYLEERRARGTWP